MGRVINPEGVGKDRRVLTRALVVALRELMSQEDWNERSQDAAAFIVLTLEAVAETVERTVVPWEKRGYWLKADRFRLEWEWAGGTAAQMRSALLEEQWDQVAASAARVGEKLSSVEVPKGHRLGEPWVGAWEKFRS